MVYMFGDVINLASLLANSLNQGVRYPPELHFSVYYVFWLSVKGGFY